MSSFDLIICRKFTQIHRIGSKHYSVSEPSFISGPLRFKKSYVHVRACNCLPCLRPTIGNRICNWRWRRLLNRAVLRATLHHSLLLIRSLCCLSVLANLIPGFL